MYEWSCSAYNSTSDRYYLPDFGGPKSVRGYTWEGSPPGMSYAYPIDEVNCTGIVTDVEFCYKAQVSLVRNPVSTPVFILVTLNHSSHFTVAKSIEIRSMPNINKCSDSGSTYHHCCDIATLSLQNQFYLPAQNFVVGISIPRQSSNVTFQGFSSSLGMYTTLSYATSVTLTENIPNLGGMTNQTLRLMWFRISK